MALPRQGKKPDTALMMEINTTPLIDVMLVLLIMLIITIPMQLHTVELDLPAPTDSPPPPPPSRTTPNCTCVPTRSPTTPPWCM